MALVKPQPLSVIMQGFQLKKLPQVIALNVATQGFLHPDTPDTPLETVINSESSVQLADMCDISKKIRLRKV